MSLSDMRWGSVKARPIYTLEEQEEKLKPLLVALETTDCERARELIYTAMDKIINCPYVVEE